ncbi:MAG: ABC transporter permease [Firmicutes bacterium]|nr:ABC transporter permease [Bacillota bacterium]
MKNTIKQLFHSPKFVIGFVIFVAILLTIFIYPLVNPGNPLEMIGIGTFAKPGTYVSLYDAVTTEKDTFKFEDADEKRLQSAISPSDKEAMLGLFEAAGMDYSAIDVDDSAQLIEFWDANFDAAISGAKLKKSAKRDLRLLNSRIQALKAGDNFTVVEEIDGETVEISKITKTDYINTNKVINVRKLPLGTDNFGRDTLRELIAAAGVSLKIGLIAGCVATFIGLLLGLLSGYMGGLVDNIISFFTNVFSVIPGFVLLILINYSISQELRGPTLCAIIIGATAWTWTTRSVRSQVISLRNRDHVNLSKLSGHSLFRIILTDILPYIASYVVMAFILQVSSGILAEAQLSMLGLGPRVTTTPTLGLMMNWATLYGAHTSGRWWAYFPVILTITLISFSLNFMNTGMDQVFNPALRD